MPVKKVIKEKGNVTHGWIVTCTFQSNTKSYPVVGKSFYQARVGALALFLKDFNIPGRPWEYVTSKSGLIRLEVKSLLPRKGSGVFPSFKEHFQDIASLLTPEQRKDFKKVL